MGTNFYACRVRTNVEHEAIQKACVEHQYEKVKELIDNSEKRYHIGKRSGGWQFIFESTKSGAPWEDNTLASIKKFLSDPSVRIENEYSEQFSPEEFWKNEVGPSLYHDPENYINGEDYDKKDPSRTHYYTWRDVEFTTGEGIRFSISEFS